MEKKTIEILEWLASYQGPPPKCCYTCLFYNNKKCSKFQSTPPDSFKLEIDKCEEHKEAVPF
jgi:hypothetical protein